MTNERLLCVEDARFTSFALPPTDIKNLDNGIADQNRLMLDNTQKDKSPSAVQRILGSLKLSPKTRRDSPVNDKDKLQVPKKPNANGGSTCGHLTHEYRKHATISTSSSDYPETDSFSDSTYSQSSDASVNSNTTSTDSDNNRIFQQGIAAQDRISLKQNSDIIDVDEGFLRRVLMLMKVVLYLRHSFLLNLLRRRKVFPESKKREIKFPDSLSVSSYESSDSQDSSVFSGRSPRARKRISFSPITLLFSAITEKAFTEAKAILEEQELDVNSQTPNGQSLLHIAAANADLKCVQLLLQHGADVNVKDTNGWSPLHAAVRRGNWKCAILLIEAGADFGEYAQARIQEYNQVLQMSTTFYRSVEIFV